MDRQYLQIFTEHAQHKLVLFPDNVYYRNWEPSLRFVAARRVAFELCLRIPTNWSAEDDQEADYFAGDVPAADRVKDDPNLRLGAIYGPVLRVGDAKQHIARHTLWRTKHHLEMRFIVLHESALLIYKEREVVRVVLIFFSVRLIETPLLAETPAIRSKSVHSTAGCQGYHFDARV